MTQQELLRIYSMYLPYGLKGVLTQEKIEDFQEENWFDDEEIFKIGAEWELCGYAPEDLMIPIGEGYFNGFLWRSGTTYVNFHRGIYPSLRPLSDLTKQIEHKGEIIIPLIELYKIAIEDDIQDYTIVTNSFNYFIAGIRVINSLEEFNILSFSENNGFCTQKCGEIDVIEDRKVVLTENQKKLWEKLYEWKFDLEGLIGKGLAVNKNEIK